MDQINYQAWVRVVVVSAALFACGYCAPSVLAGPGDAPLEAYFLPHGTELKGTIGPEYTADYYKVVVPATGRLVVTLYDIDLNDAYEQLHIVLLRTTQNSVGTGYTTYTNYVAQSTNAGETPDVIDIPDLARGIYFVRVVPERSGGWDGASYKLRATFTVFPPVVSDDVGDKKQYALPTVNQLPTICTLSGSADVDYFECHVPYNTNLTLSLTEISAGGNVDLEVYTAWDVKIAAASQAGDVNEVLYLSDLMPGQYFIKVFGEGTPQYTFTATHEFAPAMDILDDVGNDLAHAMPLLPGNPSVFCLQPYITDVDIFSIYQPEDGALTVDVYNMFVWDGYEDLYIRVLDEYGNVVAQSDNATRVPEHIGVDLVRGQYFVGVYGERSGAFEGAIYTINVETQGYDVGNAFNQAMQIHAIPYGSETYGYPYVGMIDTPGDADFFQVVLKDRGFIYLEVDRMLHANVDVQLFDAHHSVLQTSASPDAEPESIYVDDMDAGVYFIKVYAPEEAISQYRLTPTIGTPTSTISDDLGDGTIRAFPLLPYRRVNGYFWADNTNDYFTFTLAAPDTSVRVRVNEQHVWEQYEDIRLFIEDAAGNQLGFSDNDLREDEYVELVDLDPGTYYARITPERSGALDPIQYCIMVETDFAPLPSADVSVAGDISGMPGEIVYVPVALYNSAPDEVARMSVAVQFDPTILEPLGVSNAGLTLTQWDAQVRYSRSANTMSVSMDNFSTVESGVLLNLIFRVKSTALPGDVSALIALVATLNDALVPTTDGLVTVLGGGLN